MTPNVGIRVISERRFIYIKDIYEFAHMQVNHHRIIKKSECYLILGVQFLKNLELQEPVHYVEAVQALKSFLSPTHLIFENWFFHWIAQKKKYILEFLSVAFRIKA